MGRSLFLAFFALYLGVSVSGQQGIPALVQQYQYVVSNTSVGLSGAYAAREASGSCSCESYSLCGDQFPVESCNSRLGKSHGCNCNGRSVSGSNSGLIGTANTTSSEYKKVACSVSSMNTQWRSRFLADSNLLWQRYISSEGITAQYPATMWERGEDGKCPSYDGRLTAPYFVGSSGPKEVVLLLDVTGSMLAPAGGSSISRFDMMKAAAKKVVELLSFNDFVAVVAFNTWTTTYSSTLERATKTTKDDIISYIDGLEATGATNLITAFNRAFSFFTPSQSPTRCLHSRAIIYYSDGTDSSPLSYINQAETEKGGGIKVYTHTIDAPPTGTAIAKSIACATGGIYTDLTPTPHLAEHLLLRVVHSLALYSALSTRAPIPRWLEPVSAEYGLGTTATVAAAVVERVNGRRYLGVSTAEVRMCPIFEQYSADDVWVGMRDQTQSCGVEAVTECDQKWIRSIIAPEMECPAEPNCTNTTVEMGNALSCSLADGSLLWIDDGYRDIPDVVLPNVTAPFSSCDDNTCLSSICPDSCNANTGRGQCMPEYGQCVCSLPYSGSACECSPNEPCPSSAFSLFSPSPSSIFLSVFACFILLLSPRF